MKTDISKGRDDLPKHYPYVLFILSNGIYVKINPEDILFASSLKNTITIFTAKKLYEVKISLKKLIDILPQNNFIKIHKQYIVQINLIEQINYSKNKLFIHGYEIPMGRRYKTILLSRINIIN